MSGSSPTSFRRKTSPNTTSASGGTASQQSALDISTIMDLGDVSSDDGENLYTPVSDSAQLVEVVYPSGPSDTLESKADLGKCATTATVEHCQAIGLSSFSSPQKSLDSPISKGFFSTSVSSLSDPSSPSLASPSFDSSILCSTSLLETKISLEDSSLDLYPSSTDSAFVPLSSPQRLSSVDISPDSRIRADEMILPIRPSPPRKRPSDSESPLSRTGVGQKPKLPRVSGPEFLPSTLGTSYCARFPQNHRLRCDFVRTYALEAELGSGGYGFVMTARHRQDGHEVAVKFISKDKIPRYGWVKDEYGKKIPKEAWFLSKISHPVIVKFYDLYEDDIYFYLVMELHGTPWVKRTRKTAHVRQSSREVDSVGENVPPVSSRAAQDAASRLPKNPKHTKGPLARPTFARRASHDLFECIEQSKHKRFSEDDAKYIFAQLIDVVDYLDRLGITHCDIKDENVVIDKDLKIKLVDFGSVVSVNPAQERPFYKTFYGTAAYASPEIIREKPYQAPPAEIWAIGVLLSFLITGVSPFPTEDDKRNGKIVLDDANRRRMSDDCFNLLHRCLEVDPNLRANIAEVKTHPWLADGYERLLVERT
ncbi:hypothetical protein ACEPAG_8128 [Sanghuangporus baumii]